MTTPWIVAFALLWCAVMLTALLVIGLARRVSALVDAQTDGLGVGVHAPEHAALPRKGSFGLLFVSQGCGPCETLLSDLLRGGAVPFLDVYVVPRGGLVQALALAEAGYRLVADEADELFQAFKALSTPTAYVVSNGRIAGRAHPNSRDELQHLLVLGQIDKEAKWTRRDATLVLDS